MGHACAAHEQHLSPFSVSSASTINTKPLQVRHCATWPPEIPRRCILAGSRAGDLVLDPFAGIGTTLSRRVGA